MSTDKAVKKTEIGYVNLICAIVFAVAIGAAVWLRFADIGVKPFHHDEGVNAYFLLNLARHGDYKYDPTNYHGPTLYYFAFLALRVFGENDFALRFAPALFGTLTALMVWPLRKRLGPVGTPVAAFLIALSPGLVYFSRDFIHEMSFGCFSLGLVVGAWRYAESKNFAWLALMAISVGLLFATKETAIITAVVMVIAAVCAEVWDIMRRMVERREITPASFARELRSDCSGLAPSLDHLLAAIIIFVFINITFYSSFFRNWHGVTDAVKSVALWTSRSGSEHVKDFSYYFGILFKLELPLLIGSILAGIFIVLRANWFWLFVAAWALGLALSYSIIGYKTPWLMISFMVPMALLSGYTAERIYGALPRSSLKFLWALALVVILIFNHRIAWTVNFEKYDDNSNKTGYFADYFSDAERGIKFRPYSDGLYGYVYAQTARGAFQLVQAVKSEMDKLPSGNQTGIYVATPEYWPLPWYLRDNDQVAYSGNLPKGVNGTPQISQPIIIADVSQQPLLDGLPGWRALPQSFTLRPGVELLVYLRDEAHQQ